MDNSKALESLNNFNMLIGNEGLIDRAKIKVTKLKLRDNEGQYSGAATGLTYKGAPVQLDSKLNSFDDSQKKLVTSTIKRILLIVDKAHAAEYQKAVDDLLQNAKEWGTEATNKRELEKLMKLDLVTVTYRFKSSEDGNAKIENALVSMWYNNRPNPKFFSGHTFIMKFKIKDDAVEKVTTELAG